MLILTVEPENSSIMYGPSFVVYNSTSGKKCMMAQFRHKEDADRYVIGKKAEGEENHQIVS